MHNSKYIVKWRKYIYYRKNKVRSSTMLSVQFLIHQTSRNGVMPNNYCTMPLPLTKHASAPGPLWTLNEKEIYEEKIGKQLICTYNPLHHGKKKKVHMLVGQRACMRGNWLASVWLFVSDKPAHVLNYGHVSWIIYMGISRSYGDGA